MAEHNTAYSSELKNAKQKIIKEIELQNPPDFENIKNAKVTVDYVQTTLEN